MPKQRPGLESLAFVGPDSVAIAFFAGFSLAFFALAFFLDLALLVAPGFQAVAKPSPAL
jgi:hypothetical protein